MPILAMLTKTQMETWGTLALVALAVASIVWTLTRQMQHVREERAERLGAVDRGANTIYHFTGRGALLNLQWTWSVMTAGVFFSMLLLLRAGGPWVWISVAMAAGAIAYFLPILHYRRQVKVRAAAFENQMLDLAMSLSNSLRSGQALAQALEAFSHNCADPMREELSVVLREHRLGLELPDAFERMYARLPNEDLKLLTVAIRLTVKSGGSLAEVIQKISGLIRSRVDFRRKLEGLTAQGRFEALAMSLAPAAAFGLLFLADHELMLPMVTTGIGWAAIAGVVCLEVVGYVIIRKITDIRI